MAVKSSGGICATARRLGELGRNNCGCAEKGKKGENPTLPLGQNQAIQHDAPPTISVLKGTFDKHCP